MTANHVSVIAPTPTEIPRAVSDALARAGYDVTTFLYREVPQSLVRRIWNRVSSAAAAVPLFEELIVDQVLPRIRRVPQQFVMILKGAHIEPSTMRALSDVGAPILRWTFDSLSRFPDQETLREVATQSFYVDGGDVPPNAPAAWLPLGYEDGGETGAARDIDVLFVGSLNAGMYGRRARFLGELSRSSIPSRARCVFIGSTGNRLGNLRLRLSPRFEWPALWLGAAELWRYMQRARVIVNVHQDDGLQPVNPWFFAIPGAGACELAEARPYLAKWLTPGRDYIPFDDDAFVDTLASVLDDEDRRSGVAAAGRATAREQHTFDRRVAHMLAVAGISNEASNDAAAGDR